MDKQSKMNKRLSKKQGSIVSSTLYPQYLRAGAGTGKTEVLVQKILHTLDIDADIDISNFIVITFTNKATDEMKNRITESLYSKWKKTNDEKLRRSIDRMNEASISTIHSFCERLIREYGLYIGIAPNFKVKSFKKESSDIVADAVNRHYDGTHKAVVPFHLMNRLIQTLISENENRGVYINSLEFNFEDQAAGSAFWNAFKTSYLSIYDECQVELEKRKREENTLTPNDLIHYASQLLSISGVCKRVSEKYSYAFIDEFQDTNNDQFTLVQHLIDNGVKVFLVGDEKQSIYAFRGADIRNSKGMHEYVASLNTQADEVYLDENYRSTPELIDAVNYIFSKEFKYNDVPLRFPREPLKVPKSTESGSDKKPIRTVFGKPVTKIIEDLIAENSTISYGDIAVLCRRNFDLDKIASELKSNGIPTYIVGGKGFYRAKEVVDTYKFLNAVLHPGDRYQNELRFTDYYRSIQYYSDVDIAELVDEIRGVFRRSTVEDTLSYLYEKSGILKLFQAENRQQAISNLIKLKDISHNLITKDDMQPIQYVEYLNIMITTRQDEDEAEVPELDREKGVVTLYSIHKAKGLSFPVVVIPMCDNKLNRPITRPKLILDRRNGKVKIGFDKEFIGAELPVDNDYNDLYSDRIIEQLEEELRIFYVACTRAEKQIVLSCANDLESVRQTLYYRDYASVARWICEIDSGKFVTGTMK